MRALNIVESALTPLVANSVQFLTAILRKLPTSDLTFQVRLVAVGITVLLHFVAETLSDEFSPPQDLPITTTVFSEEVYVNETIRPTLYNYDGKINEFWLRFVPPAPNVFYIFAAFYTLIFIVGSSGNLLVIFMFYKHSKLLTPATILVLNLAISDFIMLVKCPLAIYNNIMLGPATGSLGCQIYGFLGGLSGTCSILTLTGIAVDRYYVVMYPLNPLRQQNNIRPIVMIIFIWIYSAIFSIIPALDIGLSTYVPEGLLTTCSFDYLEDDWNARVFMFTFFVCAYLIPLTIILFSYAFILKIVCNSNRLHACHNRVKTEQKLTTVVIVVILVWFLAWTPYSIVAMMGVFGHKNQLTPLTSMVPAIFCKLSACIDPYIYATTHPRFRTELHRFFNSNLGRRLSMIGSSFRSRSTTPFRLRSVGELALERHNGHLATVNVSPLGPIFEEDYIEELGLNTLNNFNVQNDSINQISKF